MGSSDSPLYVPEEFEAAHILEARRTVRGRRVPDRPWRCPALSLGRFLRPAANDPRQHVRHLVYVLHLVAVAVTVLFAAITGTWLAGSVVVVFVGLTLAAVLIVLPLKQIDATKRGPSGDSGR